MKIYKFKEFERILVTNGFSYCRQRGDHFIYKNSGGRHISVPFSMNPCVIKRLIKKNNLET